MGNQWVSNDEDETASLWNNNKEAISEWLVDEEPVKENVIDHEIEEAEQPNRRNIFYDVYKLEVTSIFDGPKLFHQEHINKKQTNEE